MNPPTDPSQAIRVSAKKMVYDLDRKDWSTRPTTIVVPQPSRHFDAGGMRVCFFVNEVEDDGSSTTCVAKFFKTDIPDVVFADYLNEAMAQCLSEEFAQNFNKLDTPKKISFLSCDVLIVDKRDVPPDHALNRNNFFTFKTQDTHEVVFCMEPMLKGEFTKYNSNFGETYANNKRDRNHQPTALDSVFLSAEAFSHFTLQESGGSMLVCDLQGVEDMLTDPQIHTEEGKGLGMGNMGDEGIQKWADSHKCNDVCRRLGLRPAKDILAARDAPSAPAATALMGPTPPGTPGMPPQLPPSIHKSNGGAGQIPRPPGSWDSVANSSNNDPGSWSRYQQLTHSMFESMRRNGLRQSARMGPPVVGAVAGQQARPVQPAPSQPFPGHFVPGAPSQPQTGQQQWAPQQPVQQPQQTVGPQQWPPQQQAQQQQRVSNAPLQPQVLPNASQRPGPPGTFLPPPQGCVAAGYQPAAGPYANGGGGGGGYYYPQSGQPSAGGYYANTPPGQPQAQPQPQQPYPPQPFYGGAHHPPQGSYAGQSLPTQPNYGPPRTHLNSSPHSPNAPQQPQGKSPHGSFYQPSAAPTAPQPPQPDNRNRERHELQQMSEDELLAYAIEKSKVER